MSRWDEDSYDRDRWDAPHSGPGIASFIIFMGGAVLVTLMIVIGAMMGESRRWRGGDGPEVVLIVGGVILGFILDLAALGLGIGGLCQSNRKKVFAILGTVFSGITLFAALVLLLMGLAYAR